MGWQSKVYWASVVIMPYFSATGLQLLRCSELTAFSFKWRPSAILDFKKLEILTAGLVRNFGKPTCKIWTYGNMAVFRFFKIAAIRYLWFQKVQTFDCRFGSEGQCASPSQISCRSVEILRRCGRCSIFENDGRPPSWICLTCIWTIYKEYLLVFVSVQNVFGIGAVLSIICVF